jgi:hypothetical protein
MLAVATGNAGREAPNDPDIQLPAASWTGGGGGVQTGPGIVHVSQMTAVHYLPATASEPVVTHLGGFIAQTGPLQQRGGDVRILWIALTGDSETEIGWTSTPAASYTVEAADSLPPPAWEPVGTVVSEGETSTLDVPIGSTPRFFRVQRLP